VHRLHRRPAIGDQLHLDAKEDDPSGLIQMGAALLEQTENRVFSMG
jgi:hypothetical protein